MGAMEYPGYGVFSLQPIGLQGHVSLGGFSLCTAGLSVPGIPGAH